MTTIAEGSNVTRLPAECPAWESDNPPITPHAVARGASSKCWSRRAAPYAVRCPIRASDTTQPTAVEAVLEVPFLPHPPLAARCPNSRRPVTRATLGRHRVFEAPILPLAIAST